MKASRIEDFWTNNQDESCEQCRGEERRGECVTVIDYANKAGRGETRRDEMRPRTGDGKWEMMYVSPYAYAYVRVGSTGPGPTRPDPRENAFPHRRHRRLLFLAQLSSTSRRRREKGKSWGNFESVIASSTSDGGARPGRTGTGITNKITFLLVLLFSRSGGNWPRGQRQTTDERDGTGRDGTGEAFYLPRVSSRQCEMWQDGVG